MIISKFRRNFKCMKRKSCETVFEVNGSVLRIIFNGLNEFVIKNGFIRPKRKSN